MLSSSLRISIRINFRSHLIRFELLFRYEYLERDYIVLDFSIHKLIYDDYHGTNEIFFTKCFFQLVKFVLEFFIILML